MIQFNKAPAEPLHGIKSCRGSQEDRVFDDKKIEYTCAVIRVTGSVKYKHLGPIGSKIVLKLKYYDEESREATDILSLGDLVGSSGDLATLTINEEYSSNKELLGAPRAKGVLLSRCVCAVADFSGIVCSFLRIFETRFRNVLLLEF